MDNFLGRISERGPLRHGSHHQSDLKEGVDLAEEDWLDVWGGRGGVRALGGLGHAKILPPILPPPIEDVRPVNEGP